MRDVHELRQTLVEHAEFAPDSTGLIEAAQAGAVRIRRRRRVLYSAGAVAVAATLAVTSTAILRQVGGDPQQVASAPSTPYRGALQLTVDLAPDSGLFKLTYGIAGSTQHLTARPSNGGNPNAGGDIEVHDPGTYDATALQRGERVTVQGHPAHYVPDLLLGKTYGPPPGRADRSASPPSTSPSPGRGRMVDPSELELVEVRQPAVGWPDASGAWVVVTGAREVDGAQTKAATLRLAETVRLSTPRDLRAPFRLTYTPPGLPASNGVARDYEPGYTDSIVGFGARGSSDGDFRFWSLPRDLPLTIRSLTRSEYLDSHTTDLGQPTRIAGHDTWYLTESGRGWDVQEGSGILVANVGQCLLIITALDRSKIPFEELKRLFEGVQFADCADPGSWISPLP